MYGVTITERNADHVIKWLKKHDRHVREGGGAERARGGIRYWTKMPLWSKKYNNTLYDMRRTLAWGRDASSAR